jgi:hypothetical protein
MSWDWERESPLSCKTWELSGRGEFEEPEEVLYCTVLDVMARSCNAMQMQKQEEKKTEQSCKY